jgi:hypothetical protein
MGVYYGVDPSWAAQTNEGRTHIATKGIVQSGLVLNLDAGVSSSYPGTGTTWTDLSGNGNNGTLEGGPIYSSANGGSITFDGTDDYVNLGNPSSLSFASALTISIWYYSGTIGTESYLYLKGRTDNDNYNPLITSTGGYLWTGANGRAQYINPSNYILDNTWYNLTVSHTSGSTPNIYKNAILSTSHTFFEGNGTYALGTNANPAAINADIPRALITNFNGRIPQVSIYNRALTASEVLRNFLATRSRF